MIMCLIFEKQHILLIIVNFIIVQMMEVEDEEPKLIDE